MKKRTLEFCKVKCKSFLHWLSWKTPVAFLVEFYECEFKPDKLIRESMRDKRFILYHLIGDLFKWVWSKISKR